MMNAAAAEVAIDAWEGDDKRRRLSANVVAAPNTPLAPLEADGANNEAKRTRGWCSASSNTIDICEFRRRRSFSQAQ